MAEKLFLYIDILGFKEMIKAKKDISQIYKIIDDLNVHNDKDFSCIVFSDTILVYGSEAWNAHLNQGIMWIIEFAQDLFYRLISKDIHFRAFITYGDFEHFKMKNLEAYFGEALIECYEKEKEIKCIGVFIDENLARYSDIFHTTPYSEGVHFVHVMQHLDQVSFPYNSYPISGEYLLSTNMEWWTAYLLWYLKIIHQHASNSLLPDAVRRKYFNTWDVIEKKHAGLLQRLIEVDFEFSLVINLDWTQPLARIGTEQGAWK